MARKSGGETALQKHLRVMEAFDQRRPFLTLTEISEAAGLPLSTSHRVVAELTREGLVERMPDLTYRLGVRLWEFASRTPGALGLRELARPWLAAVHERVRQHVQLGVLSGRDILFIERLSARDAVISATLIGGRLPLSSSSSGLMLLAHADRRLVDEVVRAGLRPLTPRGIRTEEELRGRLARIRAEGFAVSDGFIHADSRGIAVPIWGPHRQVIASASVVVPNDGAQVLPYVELLQWAAVRTRRSLEELYEAEPAESGEGTGAALLAGVSRKSLAYFEELSHGTTEGSIHSK